MIKHNQVNRPPTEPPKDPAEALTEKSSHEDPDDIQVDAERRQQPEWQREKEKYYGYSDQIMRHSKTFMTHISTLIHITLSHYIHIRSDGRIRFPKVF